ncbi:unnamed protein product [Sphagnum jensenii]|jgi:hypothetical protein|uniref:Uncharacterized protein n=1 Tax=Sphagnum jensenii TaxID=128206 RepID=A0ABP0X8R3_9BRYO
MSNFVISIAIAKLQNRATQQEKRILQQQTAATGTRTKGHQKGLSVASSVGAVLLRVPKNGPGQIQATRHPSTAAGSYRSRHVSLAPEFAPLR